MSTSIVKVYQPNENIPNNILTDIINLLIELEKIDELPKYSTFSPWTKKRLSEYRSSNTIYTICHIQDESCIGILLTNVSIKHEQIKTFSNTKVAELSYLIVDERYKNKGITSQLMNEYENLCKQNKFEVSVLAEVIYNTIKILEEKY